LVRSFLFLSKLISEPKKQERQFLQDHPHSARIPTLSLLYHIPLVPSRSKPSIWRTPLSASIVWRLFFLRAFLVSMRLPPRFRGTQSQLHLHQVRFLCELLCRNLPRITHLLLLIDLCYRDRAPFNQRELRRMSLSQCRGNHHRLIRVVPV
jgi:hypothetical protein